MTMVRVFSGTLLLVAGCSSATLLPVNARDGGVVPKLDAGRDAAVVLPVGDAGSTVDSQACERLIQKRCAYLQRCGLIADDEATLAQCAEYFTVTWCGPTKWLARVAPGVATLKYDATKAAECANAYVARACTDWATEPTACGQFLLPNAQPKQPCYDGYQECIEGACRGVSCSDRRCRPLGVEGDDCRVSTDCVSGLYCRTTSTPGVGVCSPPATVGDSCMNSNECAEGLTCLGQCLALPKPGDACVMGRCDANAYCGQTPDGGVCFEKVARGLPCVSDTQCTAGSVCDTQSLSCVASVVDVNGPCSERQTCASGLICAGLTANTVGLCVKPRGFGETCTRSEECQAHLACTVADGGYGECDSRGETGAPCFSARDCSVFMTCLKGACAPRPMTGQPCSPQTPCLWGACTPMPSDGGYLCTDFGGPGARCSDDHECASGRCVSGQCLAACTP